MSIISEGIEKVNRYSLAITEITGDNLLPTEQAALARLLYDYCEAENNLEAEYCAYQGAVDFLRMAFRITHEQKMSLLDLLG